MSRRNIVVAVMVLVAFGVGTGFGVLLNNFILGANSTPSRETSEVVDQLSLNDPTPTPVPDLAAELAEIETKIDALSTEVAGLSVVSVADATEETPAESAMDDAGDAMTTTEDEATEALVDERALFRITEDESEARFRINEVLAGIPTEVVGTTRRVAGDIIVNFSDPDASQLGDIAINVRTLRTDNEFRDQAIRAQILRSSQDEFEFVIFSPTELANIDLDSVAVGDTVEFQITGDLTVRGATNPVTFDVAVTVVAEDRLEGTATTQIEYPDFGISINAPPTVAGIEDQVILELDFVALRVEE